VPSRDEELVVEDELGLFADEGLDG
jgi:hypothetical protein